MRPYAKGNECGPGKNLSKKKARSNRPCSSSLRLLSSSAGATSRQSMTIGIFWLRGQRACNCTIGAPGATSSQDLDLVQSQRSTPRSLPVPNALTLWRDTSAPAPNCHHHCDGDPAFPIAAGLKQQRVNS